MALVGVRAQVCSSVDQWELTLGVEKVCSWEVGLEWSPGEGTGVAPWRGVSSQCGRSRAMHGCIQWVGCAGFCIPFLGGVCLPIGL